MKSDVFSERIRKLSNFSYAKGTIIYWMSRDQRAFDNWALIYARELAERFETSLGVLFCLAPKFLDATLRQYDFMIKGLKSIESDLNKLNIPFFVLTGDPEREIPKFIKESGAGALVGDFSPLKIKRGWNDNIIRKIDIPFFEIDAHNIVPCWVVSEKQEYAAYTIRPKINRLLDRFMDKYPALKKQTTRFPLKTKAIKWREIENKIKVDRSVRPVDWCKPGYHSGMEALKEFKRKRLSDYNDRRNDPTQKAQSDLSPYLHFGQISAQRVAMEISAQKKYPESVKSFLEELIVRRELSDNYCFYNDNYDSIGSFPSWALETLKKHLKDKREYVYSRRKLETAETHDPLWNAAQNEMVYTGKMHGFLRMYWAKKILEWSKSPEEAFKTAIYLNDRYQLDGRDPNGFTGVAWSIGGVHDRPWPERKIFGKIRYMSYDGCRRKFDIDKYISNIEKLKKSAK
jgi:deoxyribodipyrimidine photo-lyase